MARSTSYTRKDFEKEIDVIHVYCGSHCRFLQHDEENHIFYYQCNACQMIVMAMEYVEQAAEQKQDAEAHIAEPDNGTAPVQSEEPPQQETSRRTRASHKRTKRAEQPA